MLLIAVPICDSVQICGKGVPFLLTVGGGCILGFGDEIWGFIYTIFVGDPEE